MKNNFSMKTAQYEMPQYDLEWVWKSQALKWAWKPRFSSCFFLLKPFMRASKQISQFGSHSAILRQCFYRGAFHIFRFWKNREKKLNLNFFLILVLHKKWSFPLRTFSVVAFTEEIVNGKLQFLCSAVYMMKRLNFFKSSTVHFVLSS